jgi:hypothetical protein
MSDKMAAAYLRGDLFDKRRKLMDARSSYCASKTMSEPAVVAFEQRGGRK